jgi:8-hydroxy-5-deazaflavin:NADPH oxidoreductase
MPSLKHPPETFDIGVLGTGRMGLRLARMFARTGRRVVLGSRDPDRARSLAAKSGEPMKGGSYDEAIAARAVLPAIFIRDGLFDILEPFRTAIAGKLLVDISNPFNADYSDFLTPWDSSGAEELQRRFGEARIVGAYKNVFSEVFDAPRFGDQDSDVLVVGDDEEAKHQFLELARGTPFRYLDAGPLRNARTVERLTLLTGRLGRQLDIYPRMNWRLLGEPCAAGAA